MALKCIDHLVSELESEFGSSMVDNHRKQLCRVAQFGGDGYQVKMKQVEPQGYLSKRN